MRHGMLSATLAMACMAPMALGQAPSPYASAGVSDYQVASPTDEPLPLAPTYGPQGPPPGPAMPPGMPVLPDSVHGAFDPPEPVEPPGKSFAVEYLHWWIHQTFPPLVTGNGTGAPAILGTPGTIVLFGGDAHDSEEQSGVRLSGTYWLPFGMGLEGRVAYLGQRSHSFVDGSDGNGSPSLGRPLFDVTTGTETVENISQTGQFTGSILINNSILWWDAETNLLLPTQWGCAYPNLFVGARYMDLDERLDIGQNSTAIGTGVIGHAGTFFPAPSNAIILDSIHTRNQFYGGQIGAQGQWDWSRFFLKLRCSLGAGYTHQDVNVYGLTILTDQVGGVSQFRGGVLAQPTNSGHFTHDEISFMPEGEVGVGFHVTSFMDIFVGYDIMAWTDVVRPGDVVSRLMNPTQLQTSVQGTGLVGPAQPSGFHDTNFWAQGANLGLAFHW